MDHGGVTATKMGRKVVTDHGGVTATKMGRKVLWSMVESLLLRRVCHISHFITLLSANQRSLKRGYLEFKYYADAIHSDLTPPG